jgi:diguanylate cyclase (GGDEF)-like protein
MTPKQRHLQQQRMKATAMAVVNALLQSLMIVLFTWTGATTWSVTAWFVGVSMGSTGLFLLTVHQGWNLRFKDRWLLLAQLLTTYVIQLSFIVAAPKLWVIFLVSSLVTVNYAMLGITAREFRWTWLTFGATTALALYLGRARLAYPELTNANIALTWLYFFLTVQRLGLIGMQFSALRAELSERSRQMTQSIARIQELANHDELTGVLNRRRLMELLLDERKRSHRTQQPYAVALFDLDHFKTINDRFGHAAGDAVLRDFCMLAQAHMRVTDRFARWGGEEFALLMPVTTLVESASLAVERIRSAVASHDWSSTSALPADARVTVSAGVATCVPGESVEGLIARADIALYQAKNAGRNCLVMAA